MPVPANNITRCSMTYQLNGIRMVTTVHHANSNDLTDAEWRHVSQSVAARLMNRLLQWQVSDLRLESMQARILTLPQYPSLTVAADDDTNGRNNDLVLHQGCYMWCGFTGLSLPSVKPFRNGIRLHGIGRSHIKHNMHSQEICRRVEDIFRAEILGVNDSPDPYPDWTRPGYCVVHQDPETKAWSFQRLQTIVCSGPVKTLGGRFYAD